TFTHGVGNVVQDFSEIPAVGPLDEDRRDDDVEIRAADALVQAQERLVDARPHSCVSQRPANLNRERRRQLLDGRLQRLEQTEARAQAAGQHLQQLNELRLQLVEPRVDAPLQPYADD